MCKDVVCLNGGVCDSGSCLCLNGYSGKRCDTAECQRTHFGTLLIINNNSQYDWNVHVEGDLENRNLYDTVSYTLIADDSLHVEFQSQQICMTLPPPYNTSVPCSAFEKIVSTKECEQTLIVIP
jgi:hypothetical protein